MLSVVYAECLKNAHYAECRYVESRYAEGLYAECLLSVLAPRKLQQKSSMKLASDCNFDEKANSI